MELSKQIANFAYLDYATNIDISDAPPAEYVVRYKERLGEEGYRRNIYDRKWIFSIRSRYSHI